MRKTRDRRYVTLDIEHMRRLHQEAIEQLELLRTALETAEQASGTMRDTLHDIALDHWNAYMDVMHRNRLQMKAVENFAWRRCPFLNSPGVADKLNAKPLCLAFIYIVFYNPLTSRVRLRLASRRNPP